MSAVGDLLRRKLKEMLGAGDDLPQFDDLSTLRAVLSIHEDDTFFYQQAIKQLNQQNADLKVTEFELRTQLKRVLGKSAVKEVSMGESLPLFEKCKSLELVITSKEEQIQKLQGEIVRLEEVILEKEQQIEAQRKEGEQKRINEVHFQQTIASLEENNAQLANELSASTGKTRELMLSQMMQASEQSRQELQAKYGGELSELHRQLREGRELMDSVKMWTSKLIGLNRDRLSEWTAALEGLYTRQVQKEDGGKPQNYLTEHRQKLQARKYLMNRYLQ